MTIKRAKELVQNAEMEGIDAKSREKRAEANWELLCHPTLKGLPPNNLDN
ncbi:hypothetical protein [Microcystis aeruginosa]|nr:hypothetical protein [Microcystis aeruginosa]MDB9392259.1 hypothetical protein [Microcystis aeruginosa CS-579]